MGKLYLKEINKNDLYLLEKYNEDILSHQLKPSITSDSFVDWIQKMEASRSDSTKVHFFPYFLMLDDIPIGMPIIKTNIEIDEFWLKYGGNISYVISPSYRRKGYGTKCLHLVLEECLLLGLKKVFLTCDARNTGSVKIIQKNYGILENSFIDNRAHLGTLNYRFSIDTKRSLKLYNEGISPKIATVEQICNLDRTDINSFLINVKQSELNQKNIPFPSNVNGIEIIKYVCNEYLKKFVFSETKETDEFSRTVKEILDSKHIFGGNEIALVISSFLREKNIPTICVFASNKEKEELRTFLEIRLNNKWYLFDPINGRLYLNYDYNNPFLPDNYLAYRKALNNFSLGVYTVEKMLELINTNKLTSVYKEPGYEFIELV